MVLAQLLFHVGRTDKIWLSFNSMHKSQQWMVDLNLKGATLYFQKTVKVAQFSLTLWNPMDCSVPGPSVLAILQARIMESAVIPFPRESSQPRNQTHLLHCKQILYLLSHQRSPKDCIRRLCLCSWRVGK